ncbi:transglutaminase-like cysteine peptidase [Siculibacillus lacustris]|uniref:transglutaminase-like cysteine peptidase n=1 Tax=Siculibacillus lacustris TaxID=1549641 RepID=UPI0013F168D5|nr:transglutaminase-like cysteine peptidase [Siculibacillus lacustris]
MKVLICQILVLFSLYFFSQTESSWSASFAELTEQAPPRRNRGLIDRGFISAYDGFYNFCAQYSDQCESDGKDNLVKLGASRWDELIAVNNIINNRIVPDWDKKDYDHWSLEATSGHCNEYAIQKRMELIRRGWPVRSLSLTVVHSRFNVDSLFHLVLTVRTDRGDFILDNLNPEVSPITATDYHWIMRQSNVHPRLWVQISTQK